MSKSQRLTLGDVRCVFHLVREICELGDSPSAWRGHLLETVCRMTGTSMGISYVAPLEMKADEVGASVVIERNVPPEFHRFVEQDDWAPSPVTPGIMSRLRQGFTLDRRRLCDDDTWYRSPFYNELLRKIRLDDQLISIVPLPEVSRFDGIGLCRQAGQQPFGPRERRLIALLHRELATLWRTEPLGPRDPRADLPTRLRQVLEHVTAGMSERQVAFRMGLSQHTVHSYLKVLHRRFGAASRVELIERTRPPRRAMRPRLEGQP